MCAQIKSCFVLSTLTLALSPYVMANSASSTSNASNKEETMVVTTTRNEASLWSSPATIQVVDKESLINSTSSSIADQLRDIPGIDVTDNSLAGRKQIRIRGESSSRVLLLVDGQEVTYQRGGQNYGAGILIDESALERIEVVKGPYSVLYGSQAIGGVVNLITQKGGDKPFGGNVKVVYDSATMGWRESALLSGSVGDFEYRLNGSYADHGDRDTPDGRLPNTHFRNNGQGAWLGYRLDKHKFGLSLDRYELSTQSYYADEGQYQEFSVKIPKLEREKIGLFYDYDVEADYFKKLHIDAYTQKIERQFENRVGVVTPTGSPMIGNLTVKNRTQSEDTQNTYGVTVQANFTLPANNELILGAQYQQDKVKQTSVGHTSSNSTTAFPPAVNYDKQSLLHNRSKQTNGSLFAQNDWKMADNWSWTLGARQYWLKSELQDGDETIHHSKTGTSNKILAADTVRDNAFIVSSSVRYSGFQDTELRLAFAQGYVFPTLVQQFMNTTAGGAVTYGNRDLDAEHSNNVELGARYKGNNWYIDSALYYSEAKNYITSIACAGESICEGNSKTGRADYFYYDNINRAKTYGMEIMAQYQGWSVTPYISANIMRRQYINPNLKTWNTGEPVVTTRVGAKHLLMFENMNLMSDLYLRAATHAKDESNGDNKQQYAGWATVNLALSSEFGEKDQYRINFDLNNILNKRYQTAHESIPEAGINVAVGLTWVF
ncbi:putative outer membrane receptor [Proteus hauseri ATCC 700826]|uniref:Outer membrane receptor n=1 Tax=Proteus hauseri ATCC 700826 TaxID=1354271 RepID=A0AAJ3HS61_PROHU|nr:TonB-dependent receptor [Proteus hauseri]OAT46932.1 putative outer membrane receptor [Proteus hauseri ATCC 700826]